MVAAAFVRRGDIWLVSLDPTVGSEIRKTRPCVVISPSEMNDYMRTVIVAPMTTQGRPAPFRVSVRHAGKNGLILLDQIRAVDRTRLVKRSGALSSTTLDSTLSKLVEIFSV